MSTTLQDSYEQDPDSFQTNFEESRETSQYAQIFKNTTTLDANSTSSAITMAQSTSMLECTMMNPGEVKEQPILFEPSLG